LQNNLNSSYTTLFFRQSWPKILQSITWEKCISIDNQGVMIFLRLQNASIVWPTF